jgi:hypothetical protein
MSEQGKRIPVALIASALRQWRKLIWSVEHARDDRNTDMEHAREEGIR